jgi:hypothetical protein
LRRSFVEDDKIADAFGDRRTYRLMRLMSDAIQLSHQMRNEKGENWLDNPFRFRLALAAMHSVVEAIAPPSLGEVEDADYEVARAAVGKVIAGQIWRGVVNAKDSIELGSGSLADHINSIARSDVGEDVFGRALPAINAFFSKFPR